MERYKLIARLALCACLYMGCWGLVYPELLITSDTCNVVCEDEEELQKQARQMTAEQLYRALQGAEPGQVRCHLPGLFLQFLLILAQIGRASCRERVWTYV